MGRRRRHIVLSELNQAILMHGVTDMITPEVIHRRHFPDASIEAARSAIRRLCGQAPSFLYLYPEPLDEVRTHYCLTPRGTRILGVSADYAVPPKRQGKIAKYALSWFIHADQPGKRMLFNPRQFPEQFGLQSHGLPRHPFFVDKTTDKAKLGIILIDHNAHPQRILLKTTKPLARFLHHGWFDEFFCTNSFIVAVLTFSQRRAQAIEMLLNREIPLRLRHALLRFTYQQPGCLPLEIQLHVIPGMAAVVTANDNKRVDQ